jgi:hypothetical protein
MVQSIFLIPRIFLLLILTISVLCGEEYAVLMDAGSTGTRVYVYKWDSDQPLETIAEVDRKRTNPGNSKIERFFYFICLKNETTRLITIR